MKMQIHQKNNKNSRQAIKRKDTIDINEISNNIFGENSDAKLNYEGFIAEQGIKEK